MGAWSRRAGPTGGQVGLCPPHTQARTPPAAGLPAGRLWPPDLWPRACPLPDSPGSRLAPWPGSQSSHRRCDLRPGWDTRSLAMTLALAPEYRLRRLSSPALSLHPGRRAPPWPVVAPQPGPEGQRPGRSRSRSHRALFAVRSGPPKCVCLGSGEGCRLSLSAVSQLLRGDVWQPQRSRPASSENSEAPVSPWETNPHGGHRRRARSHAWSRQPLPCALSPSI